MSAPGDLLHSSVPGDLDDPVRTADLVLRARAGDARAWQELVTRHAPRLRRIVRVRLGPGLRRWVDSEDVVQETYRAVLAGPAGLDIEREADVLAWLARVAENRLRDLHDEAHARRRDVDRRLELDGDQLPVREDSPSELAWHRELEDIVDGALAELSPEHREVILLRDYCGSSWEAVAASLGSPSLHAAQQLHQRAWIKLRRLVAPRLADLDRP